MSRPAGSTAALAGASSVQATFTPDREGDYLLRLIVNDGLTDSAPDTVQVSTLNSAPVANAGPDRSAVTGEALMLDGSASSDVDGDPLTYAWSIASAPPGSTADIADALQVQATFTPDLPGAYIIELVVDDGTVSSDADALVISTAAGNSPPVANAGPDQSAHVGDTTQLDGSGSTDADGDALTFSWSLNARPAQSAAVLQQADTTSPSLSIDKPGTYVAQLIVRDGKADSAPDTVSVSTMNSAPVARISAPATVKWRTDIALDGSGSTDADGDALAFSWSILTRPQDSQAALSATQAPATAFTADRPGTYVVQLVVNDGQVDGAPTTTTVNATNEPPVATDDTAGTAQDAPVDIAVLGNDSDADGDALSIALITVPAHGTAAHSGNAIHYSPAAGFTGTDSFGYSATDGASYSSATVTVTVAPLANEMPVANAGPDQSVPGGSTVQLDGALSSDPDGDALAYSWVLTTVPAQSVATLAGASTATPSFTADRRGLYRATLTVNDGRGGSASDFVDITAQNRNPQPTGDTGTTAAGTAVTIDVLANDTDPDGDVLSLASVTQPANGMAAIAGASVTFTPATGFNGTTTFAYTVNDGHGGSGTAAVTVTVSGEPGEFTFTLSSTTASGVAGSRIQVPFRIVRNAGTTGDIGVALTGTVDGVSSTGAIVPDGLADGILLIAIAANVVPGTLQLQLSASSGSVVHTATLALQVGSPQPSSLDLIRAAMLAGTLDRPTSLLYRAYALAGDARLPAEYRGSGSAEEDTGLLAEIGEFWPTLTAAQRAQLEPFTLRPANPNSWYGQLLAALPPAAAPAGNAARDGRGATRVRSTLRRGATTLDVGDPVLPSSCGEDTTPSNGWISRLGASGGFRVWAHCVAQDPRAAEIVVNHAIEVYDVLWGPMTSDMGSARSDVPANTPINPADGVGDASIDIYILFPGDVVSRLGDSQGGVQHAYGWAQTWNEVGGRSSGYITVPVTTLLMPQFQIVAAHELFHVLQFAHNYQLAIGAVPTGLGGIPNAPRRSWWYVEASAEWAGAHYDRVLADELGRGRQARALVYDPWFSQGFQSRSSTTSLNSGGGVLPYAAFIWPYFIEQEDGAATASSLIWSAIEGLADPNAADERMDGVFPFADEFRKFAVRNLNNDVVNNRYEALDSGEFPKDTPPANIYQGHFRADTPIQIDFSLTTLAAYYIKLDNDVEPNLRKLKVDFKGLDSARGDLGIDVDVLLKMRNGAWESAKDYNGTNQKTWCLDEDDVESMYLVISAHQLEEAGVKTRTVSVEYSGSTAPCRPTWVGTSRLSTTQGASVQSTASADGLLLELLADEDEENNTSNVQGFAVLSANGTANMEQMIIDCERFPQPPSMGITPENSLGSMGVEYIDNGTKMKLTGNFSTFYPGTVIADCTSTERVESQIWASWLSFGNGVTIPVPAPPEQQKIKGSFNVSMAPGTNSILTIDLSLVRQ